MAIEAGKEEYKQQQEEKIKEKEEKVGCALQMFVAIGAVVTLVLGIFFGNWTEAFCFGFGLAFFTVIGMMIDGAL